VNVVYDLDLDTEAYGRADAADGYSQAEDLSSKNTAGVVLTAVGFGLFGLIRLTQHSNEMDTEAEQVAAKYTKVSPDQAEYVMDRISGSFSIDDDPAELAQRTDELFSTFTSHGYSGNHVTFLLDYSMDKGMSVDEAVTYMTAKAPTEVLHTVYMEAGEKIITDAITRSASNVDSLEDATAFSHTLIDKMVQQDYLQTPQNMANLISNVARYADVKPSSGELIEAVTTLGAAGARDGFTLSEAVNVLTTLDGKKDTGTDGAASLVENSVKVMDAAHENGVSPNDAVALIYDVDRFEDMGSDTATRLAENSVKLMEGMKEYGLSKGDVTQVLDAVKWDDTSCSSDVTTTEALRIMQGMKEYGISRTDAVEVIRGVDGFEDHGNQSATSLVTETVRLMEGMEKYDVSRSDAIELMRAVDSYEDHGNTSGTVMVTESVRLMEAMKEYGASRTDAVELMRTLDSSEERGSDSATSLTDSTIKLIKVMKETETSRSKAIEYIGIADKVNSSQSAISLADETVKALRARE